MSGRLQVRLFGRVSVSRDGVPLPLPRSRKVLALLGLLALEGTLSRSRLCDLLWDATNDPKAELRWCLSKLRGLLDEPDRKRVVTQGNSLIELDLADADVDVSSVTAAAAEAAPALSAERLVSLGALLRGDLLEGVEIDGTAALTTWLTSQRQRFRALRIRWAQALAMRPASDDAEGLQRLHAWLEAAPVDSVAHQAMLTAMLRSGRMSEAEGHLASAIRAFEQEGADWGPLRTWWLEERVRAGARVDVPRAGPSPGAVGGERPQPAPSKPRRASVAVMPLADEGATPGTTSQIASGLTDDIVTGLAKLRALFVIARATTHALRERGIGAQEAGSILNVEYVVTGRVRRDGPRMSILVELAETEQARIVWTDEHLCEGGGAFGVLDAIVNRVVATIAEEIETEECRRALLKPPNSLNAWETYHRGLWHMYRFTGPDNERAGRFFHDAIALDPTFARAHAGLSFTHFQNVFLDLLPDRTRQIDLAFQTAAESLALDDRDPAAHWAMGRASWLRGEVGESIAELQRSIDLSPNFALGHYTLGFVEAQSGDPRKAITASNTSRQLSPFDPLQFGMLGTRALSHLRLGELEEAVEWAMRAVGRPNAHAHILAIAVSALALTNRREEARKLVARIHERVPAYDIEHLLRAFRFEADAERLLRSGARRIGFGA